MKKHFFLQQGDVKIHKLDGGFNGMTEFPSDAKEIPHKPLALGEATGHHHSVVDVDNYQLLENSDGTLFLRVTEDAKVEHQEHDAFVIPVGDYVVDIVKEYDHFAEEANKVVD